MTHLLKANVATSHGAGHDVSSAETAQFETLVKVRKVPGALLSLAGAFAFAGLSGWIFGNDSLKTFGFPGFPVRPWAAIGYIFAAAAAAAAIWDKRRLSIWLVMVPTAIALWTLARHIGLVTLELPRPFFPNQLAAMGISNPALPAVGAALSFLLLAGAVILLPQRSRRIDDPSILLAGSALLLGIAGAIIPIVTPPNTDNSFGSVSALPACLSDIAIAIALLVPRCRKGWESLLSAGGSEWRAYRKVIPAILVLPVLPSLVESWVVQHQHLPPVAAEIIAVTGNILIVAGLIAWTMSRVLAQQGEVFYLARALDTANVALTDAEGTITHWSTGCERLYGYTKEQAIGARKYELLNSRCESAAGLGYLPPGPENEIELIERRSDGSEISVLERRQFVETPGRAPMFVLKLLDITKRVRAEAALRVSEERLALATAAHEVGVFEWNIGTGRIDWSPGAEERLGVEPGAIRDFERWRALIAPDDVRRMLDSVAETVASHAEKFSFRYHIQPPSGIRRAIEGSARCFYDTDGQLIRTVGVWLDTTERDEQEAALRAREAQLRSILETVPEAMVIIDEKGIIHSFSATAERVWGYRAAEVVGRNFTMLASEDEGARYAAALRRYIETGETTALGRTVPGTGRTKDGRIFPAEIRVGVARTGGDLRITMFFSDISERLIAEERASDLNAELAHLSRQGAMSELAADLAHELNQPLTAVSNLLAAARIMTERGEDPERALELLRMGGEQTIRAGEIIRRMREFVAKRDVEMRSEILDDLTRDAVDLVMVGTRPFDIDLECHFDPAAHCVFADRVQVQQVIVNLVRNAIEALRDQPRSRRHVIIRTRKLDGPVIEVSVSDSGSGLPADILETLYSRFSSTKEKSGMGIGLSISRRIVEAHGGTLAAENQPGGGATFRFTLPAVEGHEEE